MPPPNDNQDDAIILTPEYGEILGTTVGATNQTTWAHTGPFTKSNGHDVWFRWNAYWLRSFSLSELDLDIAGPMRYMVWTEEAEFRHILRVYYPIDIIPGTIKVVDSRGWLTPGFGKNQRCEFVMDYNKLSSSDVFIYVQVDAISATHPEEGTFKLKWGRSTVTSIGDINSHAAYPTLKGYRTVYKGRASVTDVSGVKQFFFGGGQSFIKGTYHLQYAGGAYQLAADPNSIGKIIDTRVEGLFNDGASGHDGITSFATVDTGGGHQAMVTKFANWEDGPKVRMYSRFKNRQFVHAGGKIGIQFRDFYGAGFWVVPLTLDISDPNGSAAIFTDNGYDDNQLLGQASSWALWRVIPLPDFRAAGFLDDPGSSTAAAAFSVLNNTGANYLRVSVVVNNLGTAYNFSQTVNWLARETKAFTLGYPETVGALIVRLQFRFLDDPDVGVSTVSFDLTPQLRVTSAVFKGIVQSSPRNLWRVEFTITNSVPRRMNNPQLTLLNPTPTSYIPNQSLGQYFATKVNVLFAPPANADTANVTLKVTDGAWSSPNLPALVTGGTPIP